jgi:multidrug efflux system outer membrane protein
MRAPLFIMLAAAIFAAGCAVGPNYTKPTVSVEKTYGELTGAENTNPPPVAWWKTFHDPELEKLVDEAARQNYSLQMETFRLREARYQRNITAGYLLPTVDADAGYLHAYGSKGVVLPLGSGGGGGPPDPAGLDANDSSFDNQLSVLGKGGFPGVWTDLYQAGLDATWEIDVFGGIRRRVQAANAQMQEELDSRRNLMITVFGEVALDYLQLRATQERLGIARNNLAVANEVLQLTISERKNGLASDLEITQAAAEMDVTKAAIPPLEAQLRRTIHALSILVSREPNALSGELDAVKPLPMTPPIVPVGLPSQLLERRPDIRAAERQMAAATANIGVAEADLFPKFALNGGSMGFDASSPATWFNASSRYFIVTPTVTWRVFDTGRILNNIKMQRASRQEAFMQYRNTILTALQEVEDDLAAYATGRTRRADLKEAVNQSQESLALAKQEYQYGLSSFLNVLTAEQTLFMAQDNLAQADQTVATNLVALYKSLGGGW